MPHIYDKIKYICYLFFTSRENVFNFHLHLCIKKCLFSQNYTTLWLNTVSKWESTSEKKNSPTFSGLPSQLRWDNRGLFNNLSRRSAHARIFWQMSVTSISLDVASVCAYPSLRLIVFCLSTLTRLFRSYFFWSLINLTDKSKKLFGHRTSLDDCLRVAYQSSHSIESVMLLALYEVNTAGSFVCICILCF